MKFIIFFCLLNFLYCYYIVYSLDQYDWSTTLITSNDYGVITLNLTNFALGETLFITYTTYKVPYNNFTKFTFSNTYSVYPNVDKLNEIAIPYDYSSGKTYEKNWKSRTKINYYVYYYKIKILYIQK